MMGAGKEWTEEQGNEGRGRFEKTLILLFSQSPLFSPEDERTERDGGALVGGRGSETTHVTLLILKLQ